MSCFEYEIVYIDVCVIHMQIIFIYFVNVFKYLPFIPVVMVSMVSVIVPYVCPVFNIWLYILCYCRFLWYRECAVYIWR
jgi:hypothetical protein